MESSSGFNMGRAAEISRDEVKFTKFVGRLRKKFTELFSDLLRTQLILKGVIADEDWATIASVITYDFVQDGHFAELKESEMMKDRIALLQSMESYVGKYFSNNYIRKYILKQTDKDIEDIDSEIKKEGIESAIDKIGTEEDPKADNNVTDTKPITKKPKPLV